MSSVLEISRFDGGWAVKLWDTGEVLFFASREEAEQEASRLAKHEAGEMRIQFHEFDQDLDAEWRREAATARLERSSGLLVRGAFL